MTPEEARKYISRLTYEQKVALNEMLKSLEQKRPPAESLPG